MSAIHLRHIQNVLEERFVGHIDLADVPSGADSNAEQMRLSRSVSAFALACMSDCSDTQAVEAIVDGFGDNGIDAIFYDAGSSRLYLVQGKWSQSGKGVVAGDVEKFITGVKDILMNRMDRFNERVEAKSASIVQALLRPDTTIVMAVVHTSVGEISNECRRRIDDFVKSCNDVSEVAQFCDIGQAELHRWVVSGSDAAHIDLDICLNNWGLVESPVKAYYGTIAADDIAEWWAVHRSALFAKNIRKFISESSINIQIAESLSKTPDRFWYYNNGITLLCQGVQKKLMGGASREHGFFSCQGVSVVNGAQTVGAIGRARERGQSTTDALVSLRIVSLESTDDDFGRSVTRATNTQNRVTQRDFAALDPEQERIAQEMRMMGVAYVYKTGDVSGDSKLRCTMEEATVAQACASADLRLSVLAKGQIGTLWEDIEKAPYRALFNASVSGELIWLRVGVLREVDRALRYIQNETTGRRSQVAIHGNRFVARQVFRFARERQLDVSKVQIDDLALSVLELMESFVESVLPDVYLAWTFKSLIKCQQLEDALSPVLLDRVYSRSPRRSGRIAVDPTGQMEMPFGDGAYARKVPEHTPSHLNRGVIDPSWSLVDVDRAASAWYASGGHAMRSARHATIEAWGDVVGQQRASDEIRIFVDRHGDVASAARALSITRAMLGRLIDRFSRNEHSDSEQ